MTDGDALLRLTAADALRAFAEGSLSPVELTEAVIDHAQRVEPVVNAFMATFYDEARLAAQESERRWRGRGRAPRPLEGVPMAVSDDLEIAGQPLTESCTLLLDHAVDVTEPLAARIYGSGVVVHARSATSELLCSPFVHSELYGTTASPWNPAYNAGGGAGGAAAALAAGTTVLAGGIDSIGAASATTACGVVTLKPAYGRIPLVYPFALDTYAQYSPMARSVADCALLYDQLAGPDPRDPASLPPAGRDPSERGLEDLRIAWSPDLGGYAVDARVRDATADAMGRLAAAGAHVDEVEMRCDPDEVGETILRHAGHVLLPMMARHYARKDELSPHTAAMLDRATAAASGGSISDAMVVETRLYAELAEIFERHDALVCPALAVPGLPLVPDESDVMPVLTGAPFAICNRHPYVALPSGLRADGVPTGLLVVGPRYSERGTLRIAAHLETVAARAPTSR